MNAEPQNPFFAMSYGFSEHTVEGRIEFLAESGFDGIGAFVHSEETLADFRQMMRHPLIASGDFRVFGVYMPLNNERADALALVRSVLQSGEAQKAPIWLSLQNSKATEAETLAFTQSICDLAASYNTDVILYPHDRHYILDAEDSITLIKSANRTNLYTSLHLSHELRAGNADRLAEVVGIALPYTKLVTISGADLAGNYNTGSRDWSDVVQALAQSAFDVRAFHDELIKQGYRGPIGYNNWKIPDNAREHHEAALNSFQTWQRAQASH